MHTSGGCVGSEQWLPLLMTLTVTLVVMQTQGYVLEEREEDPEQNNFYWDELEEETEPGLTCWTCPNKTDNEACNDWAPDRECPQNHTICKTIHRLNMFTGKTINVLKMCAWQHECDITTIGCHDTDVAGIQDCISCCNFAYCNEAVPTNHSSALKLSTISSSSGVLLKTSNHILLTFCVLVTMLSTQISTLLRAMWLDMHR